METQMKIRESCLQNGIFNYKQGISITKQDFYLQIGSLGLQTGFSACYSPYENWYNPLVMTSFLYMVIPVAIDFCNLKYTGKSTRLQMRGHYILSVTFTGLFAPCIPF